MTSSAFTYFASLTDMVKSIDPSREDSDGPDFAGGTLAQAMDWATHGWPDGVKRASALVDSIASRTLQGTSHSLHHVVGYDVMGAAYDAGAVALGMPEAWGVVQPEETRRALWVVLNCCASGGVPAERLMTRGIAVAALVMSLQAAGYPVTLDIVDIATMYDSKRPDKLADTCQAARIIDAATGSQLDLDRLVYAIAHPTFFRKIGRAAVDTRFHAGKWGPQHPSDALPEDFGKPDLFIGGVHLTQSSRWVDGGADWVMQEFERQSQA